MPSKMSVRRAVVVYILTACASFLLLMTALCMWLRPQLFDHPHWGLSYFGSQRVTLLPYYGGFLIVILCLAQITRLLWPLQNRWRPLRQVFLIATILAGLIAVTSSMQGAFLYWSHIYLCLVLFLWVVGAEIWILRQPGSGWRDYAAFGALITSAVVINLSGTWARGGVLGAYAWGEVAWFLAAFACLGLAALRAVAE